MTDRTRNGSRWSEVRFWAFIKSALRRASLKWGVRTDVLNKARRVYEGENKRQIWCYKCFKCGDYFKRTDIELHHDPAVGSLSSYKDLAGYVKRLFCEADHLHVVCKPCHAKITYGDIL